MTIKEGMVMVPMLDKERLVELLSENLGDTYVCTRVWSAWQHGTMSEDDFFPVTQDDIMDHLADLILDAFAPKET